jgi:hypothetical protein
MFTFETLCSGRYFVIPANQRGFSWGPRQADDIFEDLVLAGTHAHYMGPIIVTRTETPDFQDADLKTTAEFLLEDGQQRLTTFFIIANEIRKRIEYINGAPDIQSTDLDRLLFYNRSGRRLRLQNKNPDLDQYLSYVLTGSPASPAKRTPPMAALDRVQQYVEDYLLLKQLPDLLTWKNKISNQAKFIWVDLKSEGVDRYLAFDAINSRGLPLSEFDKIKNFCILVASVRSLSIQPEQEWYKAITELESFGVSSRWEEAAYITDLYAAFFDQRPSQGEVHASFVQRYRELLTRSNSVLESELATFVGLWAPVARSFGFITTAKRKPHYGTLCSNLAGEWLDRLDNMDLPTITRILLTACHLRMNDSQFETVVRACEIYTFRLHAVMGRRKDMNAPSITSLAHDVLLNGKDEKFVLERICGWLQDLAPISHVINELANGEAKYDYDQRIRGWERCYYFLYEYELANSPHGVAPILWATSEAGRVNTQEHILPQSHRDRGWWQAHWPDEAEADRFKHRLGNLVLTTNNSALSRKSINLKIIDPVAAHYYTHANATNTEKRIPTFTDGTTWRPANILRREYEMLQFAAKRWSIPCCSDNGIIQLPDEFGEADSALATISINEQTCVASPVSGGSTMSVNDDGDDSATTI